MCSQCGASRNITYCSVDCQKKDWSQHRFVCAINDRKSSLNKPTSQDKQFQRRLNEEEEKKIELPEIENPVESSSNRKRITKKIYGRGNIAQVINMKRM